MPHHINRKQLDNEYKHILASSGEDNKKLFAVITIKTERFTTKEYLFFHVYHNGSVVHSSDKIHLAIKAYNQINSITPQFREHGRIELKNSPLCVSCDHNDHCNLYLRQPDVAIKICANYKND